MICSPSSRPLWICWNCSLRSYVAFAMRSTVGGQRQPRDRQLALLWFPFRKGRHVNDLDQLLVAPDSRATVTDRWATLSQGGEERRVPLAQLLEALVTARRDGLLTARPLLDLSDAALRALQAVAERRIVRHAGSGRWQLSATDRDETVDWFVDAFVAGSGVDNGPGLTLAVHVSDDGRAELGPTAAASDRRTTDTLRAAAGIWDPVGRLAMGTPRTELTGAEVAELLDPALRDTLAEAGVHIAWAPGVASATVAVSLDEDGSLDWQLRIPAGRLTPQEITELAASQRPLVRVRGAWVVNDPRQLARLQRPKPRKLAPGEQAATVLSGSLTRGDEVTPLTDSAAARRQLAVLTAPPAAVAPPRALDATLRNYQIEGLAWLLRNAELGLGSCLADDMGLGKTVSAIAFHLALRERGATEPTLVVCPASVLSTWEREIRRFAPSQRVARYHGAARVLDQDADVVVTTYATARNDHDRLRAVRWGLAIADEAQTMKNDSTKTAHALRGIPSVHRLALSGTPIQNRLEDLWALLDWTTPGLLGSKSAFRRHFAGPIRNATEAPRIQLAKLTNLVALRRRKDDPAIAPELPAKTISDQAVALTAEQIGLYQAVVDDSLTTIADLDENARRGRILALLTALKQICNHPAQYLKETEPELPGRSGKLDALTEIIDITSAEESPALVFTQFVAMGRLIVDHLRARGIGVDFLHGGLDITQRQRLIDDFQHGVLANLVLSTHAAGTGLTLTRAEHVIHYDMWWNPAVEDQATDRAYRIGQTHPVQVHRLVCEGTLEERIDTILRTKRALSESIIDDDAAFRIADLDDAALASLVRWNGAAA
ncbi:ATP-dependent helicase [Micromonospora endophytica]|uniref:ATP-dependent helicase n=1 Tax=Micromonospora endophytica TaxID=515350 RepID=A0A2W2BQQ4_9ACTN|nr:ATP-dependent helicase [Micromonospora endophytica]